MSGKSSDTLKELGVDDDTIVVFASDNGPQGRNLPRMGNRARRTWAIRVRFAASWARRPRGRFAPARLFAGPANQAEHHFIRDVLDNGFLADIRSHRRRQDANGPTDRRRGPDRRAAGKSATGHRENLLSFIGNELVAARWKQWRFYFSDIHPTGIGPQRMRGHALRQRSHGGLPESLFNIEMDPHEDLNVGGFFIWAMLPALEAVEKYKETLKKYPNPPGANLTRF